MTPVDLLGGFLGILGLVVGYFALKHIRVYFDRSLWSGIDRGADLMQHKAADPFNPEHMQALQALAWWMRELSDQPKGLDLEQARRRARRAPLVRGLAGGAVALGLFLVGQVLIRVG